MKWRECFSEAEADLFQGKETVYTYFTDENWATPGLTAGPGQDHKEGECWWKVQMWPFVMLPRSTLQNDIILRYLYFPTSFYIQTPLEFKPGRVFLQCKRTRVYKIQCIFKYSLHDLCYHDYTTICTAKSCTLKS